MADINLKDATDIAAALDAVAKLDRALEVLFVDELTLLDDGADAFGCIKRDDMDQWVFVPAGEEEPPPAAPALRAVGDAA